MLPSRWVEGTVAQLRRSVKGEVCNCIVSVWLRPFFHGAYEPFESVRQCLAIDEIDAAVYRMVISAVRLTDRTFGRLPR